MKVPDYQRQTGLTDLPAVRQDINARDYHFLGATQAAFAENADSLMQQVNQGMAQFHAQQVQAADNSRVQDARNYTQKTINALLYGENGVLFKQGAEAFQPEGFRREDCGQVGERLFYALKDAGLLQDAKQQSIN